jgi:hypothetical protein
LERRSSGNSIKKRQVRDGPQSTTCAVLGNREHRLNCQCFGRGNANHKPTEGEQFPFETPEDRHLCAVEIAPDADPIEIFVRFVALRDAREANR